MASPESPNMLLLSLLLAGVEPRAGPPLARMEGKEVLWWSGSRFTGAPWFFSVTAKGLGSRRYSQGCLRAWLGVRRDKGSQSKHFFMKSIKVGSSQPLSATFQSLLAGGPLILPRRERDPVSTVAPVGSVLYPQ